MTAVGQGSDHIGQAVFVTDAENRVRYWNRAVAEIFGWSWEGVRGKSIGGKIVPSEGSAPIRCRCTRCC
jgi:PAS domain S-box-containing protein